MNINEQLSKNNKENIPTTFDVSNYESEIFYPWLRKLPRELAFRSLGHIDQQQLSDEEASEYLRNLLTERESATTETTISDEQFLEKIKDNLDDIINQINSHVYESRDNFLGSGMTAKVKLFTIEEQEHLLHVAVKYLETPTPKTLSASAEHDMIIEVERIKAIEELEKNADLQHISVPHPLFHHQDSAVECYGMQFIDGYDLSFDLNRLPQNDHSEKILQSLAQLDLTEIYEEIERFFRRMHEYCLHGDIKPANIMFDSNGRFYIIDFGQSVLATDIPDKAQDQLYTLREDEVKVSKECITHIVRQAQAILAAR